MGRIRLVATGRRHLRQRFKGCLPKRIYSVKYLETVPRPIVFKGSFRIMNKVTSVGGDGAALYLPEREVRQHYYSAKSEFREVELTRLTLDKPPQSRHARRARP